MLYFLLTNILLNAKLIFTRIKLSTLLMMTNRKKKTIESSKIWIIWIVTMSFVWKYTIKHNMCLCRWWPHIFWLFAQIVTSIAFYISTMSFASLLSFIFKIYALFMSFFSSLNMNWSISNVNSVQLTKALLLSFFNIGGS